MPYDLKLADRIRKKLAKRKGIIEKQMFGGIGFMLNGNMCVGVHKQEMIVRIDPETTDKALAERLVRIFDITGKPMKGGILVKPAGLATAAALGKWVRAGVAFVSSLPKK